jgi:predicted DNA binding protein
MIEITLRVPILKEFDLGEGLKIERAETFDEEGGKALLRVGAKDEEKIKEASQSPNLLRIDLSEEGGDTVASVVLARCEVCRLLEDSFLMGARKDGEGSMIWRVVVPDPASFSMDKLKGLGAEIISIKQLSEKAPLTENEDEVIRKAFEMGYFDVPRRARIRDIARIIGKSPSTIDETLRRAEKKILDGCMGR